MAGIIIGASLAILRDFLDNTVRSIGDIARLIPAPTIGIVPFDAGAKAEPLIIDSNSKSIRTEAFRQLRTNIQFADIDNPVRVFVVTSSVAEEGRVQHGDQSRHELRRGWPEDTPYRGRFEAPSRG